MQHPDMLESDCCYQVRDWTPGQMSLDKNFFRMVSRDSKDVCKSQNHTLRILEVFVVAMVVDFEVLVSQVRPTGRQKWDDERVAKRAWY